MATIDGIELGKWERGELEHSQPRRVAFGLFHNLVPKLFGWNLSGLRLVFGSLRGAFFVILSLSPVWLKFYDHTATLSWWDAALLSVALLLLQVYNFFYDKTIREYKPKNISDKLKKKLSLELSGVTASLNGTVKVKNKEQQPAIDAARAKILDCIRDASRIYLGDYEGAHVEVALLLFDDANCDKIKIANRTTTARRTGVVKPSAEVMAYYVAKSRKHRVVHDFVNDPHPFPKKSLSGDAPAYRSILLIPLLDRPADGPDTCVGVVTVDSSRPYHFWARRGDGLVVQLNPYLSLLSLFLNLNDPHRLTCPAG